jgi:glycogen debranching enzyme
LLPVELSFTLQYDADFADIFEVRGLKRKKRGQRLPDQITANHVVLGYQGLDGVLRQSEIDFRPAQENL